MRKIRAQSRPVPPFPGQTEENHLLSEQLPLLPRSKLLFSITQNRWAINHTAIFYLSSSSYNCTSFSMFHSSRVAPTIYSLSNWVAISYRSGSVRSEPPGLCFQTERSVGQVRWTALVYNKQFRLKEQSKNTFQRDEVSNPISIQGNKSEKEVARMSTVVQHTTTFWTWPVIRHLCFWPNFLLIVNEKRRFMRSTFLPVCLSSCTDFLTMPLKVISKLQFLIP